MAFELKNVVPWGRNLDEYTRMFSLNKSDLNMRIISFGDGPASFNKEMTELKRNVVSIDPIYQFTRDELIKRINETKDIVIEQTKNNLDNYTWSNIKSIQELEQIRIAAMTNFLSDFELGKSQGRYIYHELPNRINFDNLSFDLGLSSHFLIMYSQLGLDFHIASFKEMLRLCREIRIFPILNLDSKKSEILDDLIKEFQTNYIIEIQRVDYEFQKGGNEMLTIKQNINAVA
jgi:hypothetical protein